MKGRIAVSIAFIACLAGASVPVPALATGAVPDSLRKDVVGRDGNDTSSPLDLKALRLVHLGSRVDQLTFATWNTVTNTELDPVHHGNFGVGIDLNNRPRHYEYIVYISYQSGRLRGVVLHTRTGSTTRTAAIRLSARVFRVTIPLRAIGRPASYRLFLFGFYKASPCSVAHPCTDVLPNRFPLLLQDLTAPTITSDPSTPLLSTTLSAGLTYPLPLSVKDDTFGSGLRLWQVQSQLVGEATWTDVASGTVTPSTPVDVGGAEGTAYNVQILAGDRARNLSTTTRELIFPFDDQNVGVATYVGTWAQPTGSSTSFRGTTSTSSTNGDTATFAFTGGSQVCVLGMATPSDDTADVVLDSVPAGSLTENSDTPDRGPIGCVDLSGNAATTHSMVLTIGSAPDGFVIDGLEVIP
jgi:hypothetical protein